MAAHLSNCTDLLTANSRQGQAFMDVPHPRHFVLPSNAAEGSAWVRNLFCVTGVCIIASSSIFNETSVCISQRNASPLFAEHFVL